MLRAERREREPAVAHQHGRDAVPDRRGAELVPEGLGVVVSMRVDDARRHEEPVGIDRRGGGARIFPISTIVPSFTATSAR